ncbi:response regulator [Burkholderia gladioli]|uniref:response regulator n=1 Tax=Burkholderia gladioli TaxID=28095 RepID=UPI000D000361|nr:response regulator transcription factor [Burkholderia gladioli]MDN7465771.1 response regulator transcription factor [Burkholderia gladioli]MDN7812939.1 response regulator transcription factor [Burkholderia gladioli]PRE10774.1 DNA-binding response regulator [Burkholderia gladioli]
MIKVALSDAHSVVREGLRVTLQCADDFSIVGEAVDGTSTLVLARTTDADLLTLGLEMPGVHGLNLIPLIKIENPSLRILVVTIHAEESFAARAFKAGASGYITKDCSAMELVGAARRVGTGGVYVSLAMADEFARVSGDRSAVMPHQRLSIREFQIFLLIAAGESITGISGKLGLSTKTVSTHKTRILEKSGLANNAALVRYAVRHDLLEDDSTEAI